MKNLALCFLLLAPCSLLLSGCHSPGGQRAVSGLDRALFTPTAWQTNITSDATNVTAVAWQPNPATTATIQAAGSLVPGYGSLAGMAATAALGIAAHLRSRRYRAAAVSVLEGVNEAIASLPKEHTRAIIDSQKIKQDERGTRDTVKALLNRL